MILYYDLFRVLRLFSSRFGCFKEPSKSVTVVRNTPFFGIAGTYGINIATTVASMIFTMIRNCDKRFHQPRILKSPHFPINEDGYHSIPTLYFKDYQIDHS
jgi:hypothetical protein